MEMKLNALGFRPSLYLVKLNQVGHAEQRTSHDLNQCWWSSWRQWVKSEYLRLALQEPITPYLGDCLHYHRMVFIPATMVTEGGTRQINGLLHVVIDRLPIIPLGRLPTSRLFLIYIHEMFYVTWSWNIIKIHMRQAKPGNKTAALSWPDPYVDAGKICFWIKIWFLILKMYRLPGSGWGNVQMKFEIPEQT